MNFAGAVLIVVGLFSLGGGATGWPWFMNTRRARCLVRLVGTTGARIFYVLLGLGVLAYGIALTFDLTS